MLSTFDLWYDQKRTNRTSSIMRAITIAALFVFPACSTFPSASAEDAFLNTEAAAELPDFSYAGYKFGLADIPNARGETLHAADYGVIADDGSDDSAAMLDALAAAHAVDGPVTLQLPSGRIVVSEILPITRSDFVLRGGGVGPNGTEIHFPRPLKDIDQTERLNELRTYLQKYEKRQREPARNIDELFSEYSWTGGFIWIQKHDTRAAAYLEEYDPEITELTTIRSGDRGDTHVSVPSTENLKVGDAVQIHWFNRSGESGALLKEIYGDTDLAIGSHHWTFEDRPLVRHVAVQRP